MSQAVDEMRLRRATYRRATIQPASFVSHADGACGIHLVLTGHALLTNQGASFALAPGDLVLLPQCPAHTLGSSERTHGSERNELLSAQLDFEAPDHPLFSVLPAVIHATSAQLRTNPRVASYLLQLTDEVQTARDGSDALAARLTEVVLIEVMRFFTPAPGVECPVGGWFTALGDPALRRVLTAVHETPNENWTVAALAKVACESRSAFAAHFASVMREPPMAYLARWRMFRARALLRQTELSLETIAGMVGYGSAAAFSLAFTRSHATTPGAYRRRHLLASGRF